MARSDPWVLPCPSLTWPKRAPDFRQPQIFPLPMRVLIGLAQVLPNPVTLWVLGKTLPKLPELVRDALPE